MITIAIEEAQANLSRLIDGLAPEEEITITQGQRPVAKIVGQCAVPRKPRQPGSAEETDHSGRGR